VPLQLGGGIREEADVERAFSDGVARVVVGTRAVQDPDWFAETASKYPGRLVLGLDAKSGLLATHGWLETSQMRAVDLARRLADVPLAGIVYTDIERDGMMKGPNLDALKEMIAATEHPIIASGGISGLPDVERVQETGAAGVIIGRALYDEHVMLSEAVQLAGDTLT
jgi:phosphoribosylformimino-5-aminoimidazole carboxamide ribotide isomerase